MNSYSKNICPNVMNEVEEDYIYWYDLDYLENYRQLKTNEDLPRQYAEELGLDMVQFDKDVNDPALDARISREINQMKQSGIPRMSVPKFLINGKEPQARSLEAWSSIIEGYLKK